MYAENCSGVEPTGLKPCSFRRSLASFDRTALFTSAAMRVESSRGIFAGPQRPYQDSISKPGSADSATVGVSGIIGRRSALVTARRRSLPDLASGYEDGMASMRALTWPARRSAMAAEVPLYGTTS